MSLETYFRRFRRHVISPSEALLYADWTASGRLYRPIEDYLVNELGPWVANTHTMSTSTSEAMTQAYHDARHWIKHHVNAGPDDVLVCGGSGMTAMVNKLQRLLGLRLPERFQTWTRIPEEERPIVVVTHMEHHSNQTSWETCHADVKVVPPGPDGMPCPTKLREVLRVYQDRKFKIGAFTAASNVTGLIPDYYGLAAVMHEFGGICFVDFAASAPYVDIDMHPADPTQRLDAIAFSPHKFLGGPGSSGVLLFNRQLYRNQIPDHPGGGTVAWTNPWGGHRFYDDIEEREDGGTPPVLQTIKAALAIRLKESMGTDAIAKRKAHLMGLFRNRLKNRSDIHWLSPWQEHQLAIQSFYVPGLHYNLLVKMLNDRFRIQTRGGCSCAGTYGHFLLDVDRGLSDRITDCIDSGDLSQKPGWVRVSLHPTMTDFEIRYLTKGIATVIDEARERADDYRFDPNTGEFESEAQLPQTPRLAAFQPVPDSVFRHVSRPISGPIEEPAAERVAATGVA